MQRLLITQQQKHQRHIVIPQRPPQLPSLLRNPNNVALGIILAALSTDRFMTPLEEYRLPQQPMDMALERHLQPLH